MAAFDLDSYATVGERIEQFYQDFPNGSIRTFLATRDGPEVIFEARIYRTPDEAAIGIYTSGWAREVEGKSPVNRTSHLENGETSAVGRALANLGYATDARRPTRNEMISAAQAREEHAAYLTYIRTVGVRISEDALFDANGRTLPLKEYIRDNWEPIKERRTIARVVVDAVEAATGIPFEAAGEAAPARAA